MSQLIVHTDLSQPIYDQVKKMILSRELEPGQKIVQEKLAADLGVSRTPLNKALNKLEQEMLVESIPRRGMYVKSIDLREIREIFEVREGLESIAARLIAEKQDKAAIQKLKNIFEPFINASGPIDPKKYQDADERFHLEFINAAENEVLKKFYVFKNLYPKIVQMGLVRGPEETLDEHIRILDALEQGDVERSVYEVSMHIRNSTNLIIKAIGLDEKDGYQD